MSSAIQNQQVSPLWCQANSNKSLIEERELVEQNHIRRPVGVQHQQGRSTTAIKHVVVVARPEVAIGRVRRHSGHQQCPESVNQFDSNSYETAKNLQQYQSFIVDDNQSIHGIFIDRGDNADDTCMRCR
jgi:hypothetical protein